MILWHLLLPAAIGMALVPGANQVLGMRNAAVGGVGYALAGVVGRFTAFALLVTAVVVGLGSVLQRSATAFEVLRWAGIAYLVWLGVTTIRRAGVVPPGGDAAIGGRWREAARRELLTALTNPKALLLFAAFLPQFVAAGAPSGALVVVAAVYTAVEALAALLYIGAGRLLRLGGELSGRTRRRLDLGAGMSFLGFGGYLALAERPS